MPYLNEEDIDLFTEYDDDDEFAEYDDDDESAEYDDDDEFAEYDDDDDESAEYDDDDESIEYAGEEGFGEFEPERRGRRRRRRRRRRRTRYRKPRRATGRGLGTRVKGRRSGKARLPGGRQIRVRFPKNLVTSDELKGALAKVGKQIRRNGIGITRLDKAVKKVDTMSRRADNRLGRDIDQLRKKHIAFEKNTEKKLKDAQQMAMMMQFMQPKPEIQSITFEAAPAADTATNVSKVSYKEGDNTMLMMAMMMGGGFGGDSSNMMMMLLMMQAFEKES